jgi:hypothetical protein
MNWFSFFVTGWGVGFTAYIALQIATLLVITGYHRKLVWIPAPVMALVLTWSLYGFAQESNLWPVPLIIVSPFAALYLLAVCLFAALARARAKQGAPHDA